jgi:hypothetical protein
VFSKNSRNVFGVEQTTRAAPQLSLFDFRPTQFHISIASKTKRMGLDNFYDPLGSTLESQSFQPFGHTTMVDHTNG